LEQARILANPLRVRLLREFVEEPRTTKQVAERLGEKAPKLYRHVQALVDAGLLVRTGERKKRGTTERYLQAVAYRFEVDKALFAPAGAARGKGGAQEMAQLIRTMFANAQDELVDRSNDDSAAAPVVARIFMRGSRAAVGRIQRRIMDLIAKSETRSQRRSADEVELSGLVAFHVTRLK
jgi:DNA-binding transcriptional ArsR family regulator